MTRAAELAVHPAAQGYLVVRSERGERSYVLGPRMDLLKKPNSTPAAPPARSPEDARLLADMMANRELKVRITNPEAIRDRGGSSGGGSPGPGYAGPDQ